MNAAFETLLPIVLLIALGHGLARWRIVDAEQWGGIERLGYFVLIPALFVKTLALAPLSLEMVAELGGTFVVGVLSVSALCFALRRWLRDAGGVDGPAFTSLLQGATRWNTMVALAVVGGVFGGEGLALLGIAVVSLIPLINVINVVALARFASPDAAGPSPVLRSIASNPFILACLVGLALNLADPPLPDFFWTGLDMLGAGALPLSLLVVGAGLDLGRLARPDTASSVAIAAKFVLMPAVVFAAGSAVGLEPLPLGVAILVASMPAPGASYMLARQMGGDAPLMARIVTLETILALAVLPVVISLVAPAA